MKRFYNLHNFFFIVTALLITIYSILEGRVKIIHLLLVLLIFIIAIAIANLELKSKDKENKRLKGELGKSKLLLKELRDKIRKL